MSKLSSALRSLFANAKKTAEPPQPLPTEGIQCVQADGFRIYVDLQDEFVGAAIAKGVYEPHVTAAIRRVLRPGDTFVDLGVNVGYFSLLAASLVGRAGNVIGFEARPDNASLARQSARENGFENITIHSLAVAEKEKVLKMLAPNHTSLSVVVDASRADCQSGFVEIRAVAVDDMLEGVADVDVIKMDIDGGEFQAVQGMIATLRRWKPILFFEFCPFTLDEYGQTKPEELIREIQSLGYQIFALTWGNAPIPMAGYAEIDAFRELMGGGTMHVDLVGVLGTRRKARTPVTN